MINPLYPHLSNPDARKLASDLVGLMNKPSFEEPAYSRLMDGIMWTIFQSASVFDNFKAVTFVAKAMILEEHSRQPVSTWTTVLDASGRLQSDADKPNFPHPFRLPDEIWTLAAGQCRHAIGGWVVTLLSTKAEGSDTFIPFRAIIIPVVLPYTPPPLSRRSGQ